MKELVHKYVLANAVRYNGKASLGSVIGLIMSRHPYLKSNIKGLSKEINNSIIKVNSMRPDEQIKELEKIGPELLKEEKKEEKKFLKELPNIKGKVVMRVAPSPSGPLHIGHAYVFGLTYEYIKKYKGTLILRIEDTNPENVYKESYKLIKEDMDWLTNNNVDKFVIQSSRMENYYKYCKVLLKKCYAYVCTCSGDEFREFSKDKKECPCRNLESLDQLKRWEKMFKKYKPGEAVVRIKTDMQHENPAMRDWPAFRINESTHSLTKKKYRVWPLMNFSVAIDDHDLGVTHSIRGKDHMDNEKRQNYLFDYFKWEKPTHLYVGKINFKGFDLSTSETRELIKNKKYLGWNDIRLPFLQAFKRRGYDNKAFLEFSKDMGLNETDKTVEKEDFFKILNFHNKEIIDSKAKRFFFVINPVKILVNNAPKQSIELDLHPDNIKGGRKFKTFEEFYLAKEDYDRINDTKTNRLMDCLNFTKNKSVFNFSSIGYEDYKNSENKGMIMHYLPKSKDLIKFEVLTPDKILKGLAENGIKKLKVNEVIQAERFGFIKLESKGLCYKFVFSHK